MNEFIDIVLLYRSKDPDETSSTVSSSLDHDDSSVKLDDSPAIGRNNSSSDKDGPANLPARTGGENGGIVSGKVSRFAWSKEQKRFLKKILSSFVSILKNWKRYVSTAAALCTFSLIFYVCSPVTVKAVVVIKCHASTSQISLPTKRTCF